MNINLYVSYYKDKINERNLELEQCLLGNLTNAAVDNVYLLAENTPPKRFRTNSKVTVIPHKRPTFTNFFNIVNDTTGAKDLNIVVNSDIYLPDNIADIHPHVSMDTVACMSRWELQSDGSLVQARGPRGDSQDAWMWRGKIREVDYSDFNLGVLGCDNRIAWEFMNVGYRLINPCETFKITHVHNSKVRNYRYNDLNDKVSGPYQFVSHSA